MRTIEFSNDALTAGTETEQKSNLIAAFSYWKKLKEVIVLHMIFKLQKRIRRVAIAQVPSGSMCACHTAPPGSIPSARGIGLWRFISHPSTLETVYLSWLA